MKDGDLNTRPGEEEPQAPAKLVAAFKEPSPRRVFVPPVVDESILRAARRHLGAPASNRQEAAPRTWFRSWLVWPMTAAACLVLIGLIYFATRQAGVQNLAREDVNQDGRVDILDAFQLERQLQAGKAPSDLDLNDDGIVDRRDVELITAYAVKLEKGGRS